MASFIWLLSSSPILDSTSPYQWNHRVSLYYLSTRIMKHFLGGSGLKRTRQKLSVLLVQTQNWHRITCAIINRKVIFFILLMFCIGDSFVKGTSCHMCPSLQAELLSLTYVHERVQGFLEQVSILRNRNLVATMLGSMKVCFSDHLISNNRKNKKYCPCIQTITQTAV